MYGEKTSPDPSKFTGHSSLDVSARAEVLPVAVPLNKIIPIQKIIRLSQVDLAAQVEASLNENPFLEKVAEEDYQTDQSMQAIGVNGGDKIIEVGELFHHKLSSSEVGLDEKSVLESANASRGLSLTGELLQQLDWLELSQNDHRIGEAIISLIGEEGYVNGKDVEEVRKELNVSIGDFNRVWYFLKMNLDPPGVGCKGVEDSLAFQLLRRGFSEDDLSVKIVRGFFLEFSKKQYRAIARTLGVTSREVRAAFQVIQSLDPYPLRNRDSGEFDNNIIVPDVVVRYREGRLEVMVNRSMIPQIRLLKDRVVDALKKNKNFGRESQAYLKEKKEEAEIMVQALSYRESNLKKVVDYLVDNQRNFFIEGFARLQPCRMIDVAKALNIDKGSLSRLVNSKYVATDWGVFRLREMFSLPIDINGQKVSPKMIQEKIKTLLQEFSTHKLTDQKIAMMLRELGYPIARRTVNKYRRLLDKGN